jgi:hypothetical protein
MLGVLMPGLFICHSNRKNDSAVQLRDRTSNGEASVSKPFEGRAVNLLLVAVIERKRRRHQASKICKRAKVVHSSVFANSISVKKS